MKKEYILAFALSLFVLGSVLDSISGPAKPALKMPFEFFTPEILSVYPLTFVSVFVKSSCIVSIFLLAFSYVKNLFFPKAIMLFLFSTLAQLYSIQQIATSSHVTTLEWTLSFTLSGGILILASLIFALIGFIKKFNSRINELSD